MLIKILPLTIFLALFFSFEYPGQKNYVKKAPIKIDLNEKTNNNSILNMGLPHRGPSAINWVAVDTMGNCYGPAIGCLNPLAFDPWTNVVMLVHRGATTYGTIGELYYNYSTDGGITFTRVTPPVNSIASTKTARYPSMTFNNPTKGSALTESLLGFSWPELVAGAFGGVGGGADESIGAGSTVAVIDAGVAPRLYSSQVPTFASDNTNLVLWASDNQGDASLKLWKTVDFQAIDSLTPPQWESSAFEDGGSITMGGAANNGVLYYAVLGTFPIQTPIQSGWTPGYSKSTDNGATWSTFKAADFRSIPALSKYDRLYDYIKLDGFVSYQGDMNVDANGFVHFLVQVTDTTIDNNSGVNAVVEIFETATGWDGKVVYEGIGDSSYTKLDGPALGQMGPNSYLAFDKDKNVMVATWNAPRSLTDSLVDIYASYRTVNGGEWSTPVNLTDTPGMNENSHHMAPYIKSNGNNSYSAFVFYNYPAGYTGYFPNQAGLDIQPTVCYVGGWTFTTPVSAPATPTLVSPTNGATNQSLTPTLTWNTATGASTYRLQVSTNSGFTSFVFDDSTLTTASKTLPTALSFNTLYYWRVNAKNTGGTGGYSTSWTFTTIPAFPTAPSLATPLDGAIEQSITPTLAWNSVSGASTYRLQVSTNSGFTSFVFDDSTITETSKTLPAALANNTQYYWRVNAKNAGGTGGYSSSWTFTTIPAIPTAPTLATPLDGAIDQSITPTLTWNAVSGAIDYRFQLSNDSTFAATLIDENSLTGTNKNVSNLVYNKTYFWRVNARNIAGASGWSEKFRFSTIKPTISLLSPNGGENMAVGRTYQISWSSQFVQGVKLELSTNNGIGWISITSLGTGVQSYNWTIPSGTVSTSCKVRISDETDASVNDISSTAFTIFEYPSVIEVSKQVSFSGTTENSYRMVGLPGNITIPVTSVITGTQKTDWQAFRDNGVISTNRADYLIEHSASNPLSFTLGRGLWILSKNVLAVSRQESSAAINDSSYALVPLQSNWNIITNPYNRVIQWSIILTANNITDNKLLYSFNGGWNPNTSAMTPYEGYYFYNAHGLTSLKVPYDPNGALAKSNFAPLPLKISDNKISLSLVQGSEVKSNLMAAIDATASEDFDSTDYFAPPSSFEDVSIIIKNQNLKTAYKSLFAESRPMNGDGQIFDLQLKNVTGEELKFDFTGMDKFKDYEVYLFDARLKKYYNLKEKNNIPSPAYVREGKFSLLIGKSSFIESEKAKNIVNEYSLLQNYPNPFNPKTVIMYSLKAPSNVVLTVYDITGSIVAKLVDGYLSEGYHEAVFNADNLASGIYIYRLEVKNGNNMVYSSTRKMVVTK